MVLNAALVYKPAATLSSCVLLNLAAGGSVAEMRNEQVDGTAAR